MTYEASEQSKEEMVTMAKEVFLAQAEDLETLLESLEQNAKR